MIPQHLLIQGNARRIPLDDESVHCVVCSPPYWGLRDYKVAGQLGLEPTPDEYVRQIVMVFGEVRRVLRSDGTAWVNLGDSYAAGKIGRDDSGDNGAFGGPRIEPVQRKAPPGFKVKDLIGIPWRVALALQADRWWLRSDIIWSKPNPMPESVTDRPTKSHEYLFLLAKSERYYFDAEALREKDSGVGRVRALQGTKIRAGAMGRTPSGNEKSGVLWADTGYRNIRTVWSIPTESYPGLHYATYPRRLVEPCIKAGTSERGVCPECGAPWERIVEREEVKLRPKSTSNRGDNPSLNRFICGNSSRGSMATKTATLGWRPTCSHGGDPVPATVFDPFVGSGTTLVVATNLGRHGIGLDLSRQYLVKNAKRRIERPHAPVIRAEREDEHLPLFDAITSTP